MRFPAIKYRQSNFELISTVLPLRVINSLSRTLIYGVDEGGYQRVPDEKHLNGIVKYVESQSFVFPNSIILAADDSSFSGVYFESELNLSYLDFRKVVDKIFRIVDGQHRLLALDRAAHSDPSLLDIHLQVTVLITNSNRRSVEMDIFNNINSKAKRLKTDLIELAKYDYRIIEERVGSRELNAHIGVNLAYFLNENQNADNVWQNAIKIDIHSEVRVGIVGVKAFCESVRGLIECYLNSYSAQVDFMTDNQLIEFSRHSSVTIGEFLIRCWRVVKEKWPNAFLDIYKVVDIDGEYKALTYKSDFYIQKTLGCKSINYIISDLLNSNFDSYYSESVLGLFKELIYNSKLTVHDWQLGKTLSGISSESGFRRVSRIIRNQEQFVRKA